MTLEEFQAPTLEELVLTQLQDTATAQTDKSYGLPLVKDWGGAAKYNVSDEQMILSLPAVFVVGWHHQYSPNIGGGDYMHQNESQSVSVFIKVKNELDAKGYDSSIQAERLFRAVHAALFGWIPTGYNARLGYKPGAKNGLFEVRNRTVIYQSLFETSKFVRRAT